MQVVCTLHSCRALVGQGMRGIPIHPKNKLELRPSWVGVEAGAGAWAIRPCSSQGLLFRLHINQAVEGRQLAKQTL